MEYSKLIDMLFLDFPELSDRDSVGLCRLLLSIKE